MSVVHGTNYVVFRLNGPPDFVIQNTTDIPLRFGQNRIEGKDTVHPPIQGFTLPPQAHVHWAYSDPFAPKRSISVAMGAGDFSSDSVLVLDDLLQSKSSSVYLNLGGRSAFVVSHAEGPTRVVCFQPAAVELENDFTMVGSISVIYDFFFLNSDHILHHTSQLDLLLNFTTF